VERETEIDGRNRKIEGRDRREKQRDNKNPKQSWVAQLVINKMYEFVFKMS
jgi:hypothetical protein